jgi:hypothetical protein
MSEVHGGDTRRVEITYRFADCTLPLGGARFEPQKIQTDSQEFAELGEHFVLEFENRFDQISPNETETHTLFQIGLSCSLPLSFLNLVSLRIHSPPMV